MRHSSWILSAGVAVAMAACGGGSNSPANSVPAATAQSATPADAASAAADCEMFPASAIFNTRIDDTSRFPALANSAMWIAMVGAATPLLPNWGNSSNPANLDDYWGMPINVVDAASTQWPVVTFDGGFPDASDCATAADGSGIVRDCSSAPALQRRFPFPSGPVLAEANADEHVLVIDRGTCRLWEAYGARHLAGDWFAMSTAEWDLSSNALRPDGWGSADAAGLPITPLLARASQAATGEIHHALRVTFRDAALSLGHVWPARFAAGADNPGAIPFGSLLRLKSGFVIPAGWSPQAKAVALAAKRYGLYVADNGMDFSVQGEPGDGWDPAASQQLRTIQLSDMEFVDLGAITHAARFDPGSMQASW